MKKHLKKILTAALAVVLAFLIPATSVSASATDWQLTYTQTVLENAIYYYANAGYDLTFGTFAGTSTAKDRYYVWYDFSGLSSAAMKTYLEYGSKFGSVTTDQGNVCDLMYQWWLPLGSGIAEDGYFTFYIGVLIGRNSITQDGTSFTFGDCLTYNAGSPAFTFQALNESGYVDDLDDITFTIESYTQPISTTMTPPSWSKSSSESIKQVKVVVDCTNLSDYTSLGIRFWTFSNTTGTVATHINPYVYLMIDPSDMWITEADETTPETEDSGETVTPNPDNQEILNEIVAVGSQLKEINDTLVVPDSADQSEFVQKESEKAEIESQLNDHLESMGIVTLPPQDDINVDIDGIIQNNPYEESWLDAVFGGLWANKYILQTLLLSFVFAYFGFVLYGKKA